LEPQTIVEMTIHSSFSYNGVSIQADAGSGLISRIRSSSPEWQYAYLDFILEWLNDDDSITIQTSGSTGAPTGWRVRKSAMEASARITGDYFDCKEGATAILALPGSFIAGKMMLVRAMVLGWRISTIKPSARPFYEISTAFDFAAFTPMQVAQLTNAQLNLLGKSKTVILGGAAVSDELRAQLATCCNNVHETYGMAETLSHVAVRKLQHMETPFEALQGILFSIDPEHRLQIHAPHLSDSALPTQDVVELLSETSFYYRGRYDRVINSGGVKLFAEVIERKLGALIAEPFQVTSLPDAILGQRVVLYIESKSPLDESALRTKMTALLDRYEVPKEIRIVTEFERTHSGKIKLIGK
jgi:O-succinylbenzoic acid--CoA ligase